MSAAQSNSILVDADAIAVDTDLISLDSALPVTRTESTTVGGIAPALRRGASLAPASLLALLQRDAARYADSSHWYAELGFWVGATYRFGAWAYTLPFALRLPLTTLYRIVNRVWRFFLHVNIAARADIGPGLCLVHPHNVMIPVTTIGENALIFHEVTIGSNFASRGYPKIGNDVTIFVGARVLGAIVIGDDVKIGANCIVTRSVKPRSTVMPAPIRVLSRES